LIVDDDVEFAEMVREYLQPEGFIVDLAHDGAACFACEPQAKDIVVLDVMLPGQSGFEILKELRRLSSVPVLMLTARDTDTDRIVGLEIGANWSRASAPYCAGRPPPPDSRKPAPNPRPTLLSRIFI
jgi:two-component system response regulator CpxR